MAEFAAARRTLESMSIDTIAAAIENIGFSCTDCGACCRNDEDPHVATVFPDEIRTIKEVTGTKWRDVARPMPFGLDETEAGDTFEWSLQSNSCGNCTFYDPDAPRGGCSIYADRPLICQTYPFQLAVPGVTEPNAAVTRTEGPVRAFDCEGLGRPISPEQARSLAVTLKSRARREIAESESLLASYSGNLSEDRIVIHDSEGAKRPDGSRIHNDPHSTRYY